MRGSASLHPLEYPGSTADGKAGDKQHSLHMVFLEGGRDFFHGSELRSELDQCVSETATHALLQKDQAMLLPVTSTLSPSSVARNVSALPPHCRTSAPQ